MQPASVQATSAGRTLKMIWRVCVALQAAVAALGIAIGILMISVGSNDTSVWAELGVVIGWVILVISGVALVWLGIMMFASFKSNVVPAVMGMVQGTVFLVPTISGLAGNGGSNLTSGLTPLVLGGAWVWLCATYRKWPDPQPSSPR